MGEFHDLNQMFGPLNLETAPSTSQNVVIEHHIKCLLCDNEFEIPSQQDAILAHLFRIHRLVIADVPLIADLKSYITYWKHRLLNNTIEEFCTTMLLDQTPEGVPSKNEKFYLLSDVISEDKTLRYELQQKRLEKVLAQQSMERTDNDFQRNCSFCKLSYTGPRSGFLQHLSETHNLHLGRSENLVYTDELLDIICKKMNSLECIYCEKTFKNLAVLKEHMRKKMHKRINPANKSYDKFYMINYLEMGKNWQHIQKERDLPPRKQKQCVRDNTSSPDNADDSDSDWSDWMEDATPLVCLFCEHTEPEYKNLLTHMQNVHGFDFIACTTGLDFYKKVKLVNYIRRRILALCCVQCGISFNTRENLLKHLVSSKHIDLRNTTIWDEPEYFFPTYENDTFLCFLEDEDCDEDVDSLPKKLEAVNLCEENT